VAEIHVADLGRKTVLMLMKNTLNHLCLIEVYSIQHYVIKFVSNLRWVGGVPQDFLHQ
jgi:hypothetical protein